MISSSKHPCGSDMLQSNEIGTERCVVTHQSAAGNYNTMDVFSLPNAERCKNTNRDITSIRTPFSFTLSRLLIQEPMQMKLHRLGHTTHSDGIQCAVSIFLLSRTCNIRIETVDIHPARWRGDMYVHEILCGDSRNPYSDSSHLCPHGPDDPYARTVRCGDCSSQPT